MGQACSYTQVAAGDGCWSLAQSCGITQDQFVQYNGGGDICSTLQPGQYVCCSEGVLPDIPAPNPDGTCVYQKVQPGDGCWALADRCKITQDTLVSRNRPDLCSTLEIDEHVCCSKGPLPDFSPKPNADGSCFSYTVKKDDNCWDIGKAHYVTSDQIGERNTETWGWMGCSHLVVGNNICLSTGSPPMPAPIEKAVCGPQVSGTPRPANMDNLANLNPCPLNACCNVWGQCGMDANFCIPSPVPGGAPGTATPGSNGCISSCGLEIVGNDSPPAEFKRIAYWEAWNADRPCLHMRASNIDTEHYSHVHFAFGNITADLRVDVSGLQSAYNDFKALTGVKRIMSFGGWTFSTDWDTYPIFREGITPEQRYTFAQNVVNFIVSEGLEGVDFDWEYPGAPDIPGIPPASTQDGENYLAFLRIVRQLLPSHLHIGIAAPASFWYLKGFPLDEIADVVDYIVYMTYDLHGQWDYGNIWTSPGCPNGDCLRSHVNRTETELALVMATKAGVPAHKIIVGMPMYGRSFQMAQAGCWGPDCLFVGPESGAAKGRCTDTSGYISNFEIREIIATNPDIMMHTDDHGDILVYNGDQWVSWLSKSSYQARVDWITGLNFGGTSDWAVDLDVEYGSGDGSPGGSPGGGAGGDSGAAPILISPDIYDSPDAAPEVRCHPPCTFVFPPWQLSTTTTISMPPVTVAYSENWEVTTTINGAPITTSTGIVTSTVVTVPPIATTEIPVWNHHWDGRQGSGDNDDDDDDDDDAGVIIYLTSSVIFPPVTLTRTRPPVPGNTKTETIVWTYRPAPFPTLRPIPVGEDEDEDDDPVVIIPPPPPPGAKGQVKVKKGDDGPKCGSGQKCGSECGSLCDPLSIPCLFLCGCIGPFCDRGSCVGPGCFDFGHGGGGGGGGWDPNDPDQSTCRTRTTVSDCEVECSVLKYSGTTRTRCKDESCDYPITACSATGTTTTTTTTLSCAEGRAYTPPVGIPVLGGGGAGGTWVVGDDDDDPTSTPQPPATTTTAGGGGDGGGGGGEPTCTERVPPLIREPPANTPCELDTDCDYFCPACEWAGCVKMSMGSPFRCMCLPTRPLKPGGEACGENANFHCLSVSCPAGERPSCEDGMCACVPMSGRPPAGAWCTKDRECAHYTCDQGEYPACMKTSLNDPRCRCWPIPS